MPIEHDSNRSDRLLRTMRPVLSHDLPNQLVALQGLLQMLELDEAASLGAPAQETVFRLQRVARRTCEMARFLREVERESVTFRVPGGVPVTLPAPSSRRNHWPFLSDGGDSGGGGASAEGSRRGQSRGLLGRRGRQMFSQVLQRPRHENRRC
jgi:hypothetical protein